MSSRFAISSLLLSLTVVGLAGLSGCAVDASAGETEAARAAGSVPVLSEAASQLSATDDDSASSRRRPQPTGEPLLDLARGRWLGRCDILITGRTEPALSVEIERITEPTGVAGEMSWTLIYRDANGEQVRPYTMRADAARPGRYLLDENNGIVLTNYLQGGNILKSDFEVQGIRLTTREEFARNKYDFEISVAQVVPELSSDLGDGFVVDSYRVLNTQKCSMKRVRGHGGGADD